MARETDDVFREYDEKVVHEKEVRARRAERQRNEQTQRESGATTGIPITWLREARAQLDSNDVVEDLLGAGSMLVIYGESGCGKTFFMTDLGLHIALGWSWRGRRVQQTGVVYCALEGGMRSITNRLEAFKVQHGLQERDVPFGFVAVPLDFCWSDHDCRALSQAIKDEGKRLGWRVGMVVLDTLARGLSGGNENGSEDMGALVINTDRLRRDLDTIVGWVHHTGKDAAAGARGHSSLKAATDTEIEVQKMEDGSRLAKVTKQRDYECQGEFPFHLTRVHLGENTWGKPVTSCVVDADSVSQVGAAQKRHRLSPCAKRALKVLLDLLLDAPAGWRSGVPGGFPCADGQAWRDRFYGACEPGAPQGTKQRTFKRASDELITNNVVGMANGVVWHCYHGASGSPDSSPDKNGP
jgi:AAA domain